MTLPLPQGGYRFRADKGGEQYWSGATNHCTVPGCTEATITVGSQAMGVPVGGLAFVPGEMPALAEAETLPNPSFGEHRRIVYRPPGLAALPSVLPQSLPAQSGGAVTVTRVITYTYDPLNRLTEAQYSTGEQFEYAYDAVGNRTAMTTTEGTTTYEYDAANRLTSVDDVTYTWDNRGNLVSDGTFTYTYNAAGQMVRAEGVTLTLVYTYNAQGLRVVQSVDGDVTTYAWDWASGIPEMLSDGDNLYLVGHETLGRWDGAAWVYYLPDALGSVRQTTDIAGTVLDAREWMPFGVEVNGAQAGLGYAGEWQDPDVGLVYLRARWYDVSVGRFTRGDPWPGTLYGPQSLNTYPYAINNPVLYVDASGECPPCWLLALLGLLFLSPGCTGDFDCSDVEIAPATADVECKGLECSKKMIAAFWLPQGNQTTFRNKCAVIQWARGTVYDNGELVPCDGEDCRETPLADGIGRSVKMCPPGGNCQTVSSSYWHVDQNHSAGSEYSLFDSTDAGGMSWERFGFELPEDVPKERAIYMQDTPTIRAGGPGHELKINLEFAIAVYNRDDLKDLPTHGGDLGSPDEPPLPCDQERWYFYKESYITQPD